MRQKCPDTEFSLIRFSPIFTKYGEYGKIQARKNSVFGHCAVVVLKVSGAFRTLTNGYNGASLIEINYGNPLNIFVKNLHRRSLTGSLTANFGICFWKESTRKRNSLQYLYFLRKINDGHKSKKHFSN